MIKKKKKKNAVWKGLTFIIQNTEIKIMRNIIISDREFLLYFNFKFELLFLNKFLTFIWLIVSNIGFANIRKINKLKVRTIKYSYRSNLTSSSIFNKFVRTLSNKEIMNSPKI